MKLRNVFSKSERNIAGIRNERIRSTITLRVEYKWQKKISDSAVILDLVMTKRTMLSTYPDRSLLDVSFEML